MFIAFHEGYTAAYIDKDGEIYEGTVARTETDAGLVYISDDGQEYAVHHSNVVQYHSGPAKEVASHNQLEAGSVKKGDVILLSADVSENRHWLSVGVVTNVSSVSISVTDPSKITGFEDNQGYTWDYDPKNFYVRASRFAPFALSFRSQEISQDVLSYCLDMVSNCTQYGGPNLYPACENTLVTYALLELVGCVDDVAVSSSRIVSASITEYGRRVQSREENLSIIYRLSSNLMNALASRQVGFIDQARNSLGSVWERTIGKITEQLGGRDLSPETHRELSNFFIHYVTKAFSLLADASSSIANANFHAARVECQRLRADNNALREDNAALRARLSVHPPTDRTASSDQHRPLGEIVCGSEDIGGFSQEDAGGGDFTLDDTGDHNEPALTSPRPRPKKRLSNDSSDDGTTATSEEGCAANADGPTPRKKMRAEHTPSTSPFTSAPATPAPANPFGQSSDAPATETKERSPMFTPFGFRHPSVSGTPALMGGNTPAFSCGSSGRDFVDQIMTETSVQDSQALYDPSRYGLGRTELDPAIGQSQRESPQSPDLLAPSQPQYGASQSPHWRIQYANRMNTIDFGRQPQEEPSQSQGFWPSYIKGMQHWYK